MALSQVLPMARGIAFGLVSTEAKRLEDSVAAGENAYSTASIQMLLGGQAAALTSKALEAAGRSLPFIMKVFVYLAPPLLAIARNNTNWVAEENRPLFHFIQRHLGTVYQLAAAVSALALLYFGQTFFAVSILVLLGIGTMDRNGWLPVGVRHAVHRITPPALIVTGLLTGGILDKIFSAITLAAWGAKIYLDHQKRAYHRQIELPSDRLTHEQMLGFLNGRISLQTNREHIHCNPFPPVPQIDIQTLLQKWGQIDWNRHLPTLRIKLRQDQRFMVRHGDPSAQTDPQIIAICTQTLQAFITSVKEQRILEGEPVDYEKLHNYLKIIAKYVQNQPDEMTYVDVLFRLAVEGGEYCGPGKFEVAESVYAQTLGENHEIPLRDKIFHCLQDERNLWMQKFYHLIMYQSPVGVQLGRVIDRSDIHLYNQIVNLYGDELGLRKTAADNDDTATVDPLARLFVFKMLRGHIDTLFWNEHQLCNNTDTVINAIGTAKLPKPEVYAYWQNWIERQLITEAAKQELRDELMMGQLFGRDLEVRGKFVPEFIRPMLYDIGIAEIALS